MTRLRGSSFFATFFLSVAGVGVRVCFRGDETVLTRHKSAGCAHGERERTLGAALKLGQSVGAREAKLSARQACGRRLRSA